MIKLGNQLILCRLDKINSLVKKGQPLKQWSCRGMGEVKARLEVIINYQCLGKVGRSIKPIICGGEAEIRGETKPLLTFFMAYPIVSNAMPQN